MGFKIDWIGTVAIGLKTPRSRPLAFSLEEGQEVPSSFRKGDDVRVSNHPEHPAYLAMGVENGGYYEITHIASGAVLRTWHKADMYKVE